ncbi:MAG: hypothetical protein KBS59_05935 [Clostridiales bacterium]|nr:hypothetical protein [Clostridiales bacterium]
MAADWKKIRAEYIRGGISHRKLAEKYGISRQVISERASKEKWKELRDKNIAKTCAKIAEKTAEGEAEETVDYLQMIYDINDEAVKHIRELMAVTTDAKSMASYMKALQTAMDIKRTEKSIDGESRRIAIEEQKLELEKSRAQYGEEDSETGVIEIAPVIPREGDGDG